MDMAVGAPVFYGAAAILIGHLLYRSRFLPKFMGILWLLGGIGQMMNAFEVVVTPAFASFGRC